MSHTLDMRIERAAVLVEALPYIRRFSGHTVVIKLGGAAIESGDTDSVLQDVVLLRYVGLRPVLVHGGGPEITAWQKRMGIETRFVDGLRVTDADTMELARMVLTGKIGPDLVSRLHRLGGDAIGLSGEDGPTLLVRPRGGAPDLGYVGEVVRVNPEPIEAILDQGRIPVIACIGMGYDGHSYNVNADSVAAELAVALDATRLILLTDVEGVKDGGEVISELDPQRARHLIESGAATGGMIPKLEAALRGLDACEAAHILDGRLQHALLLELLTESGVGTMLRNPEPAADGDTVVHLAAR